MKSYLLELDDKLRIDIKIVSAKKEISMKDYMIDAIKDKLQKEEVK